MLITRYDIFERNRRWTFQFVIELFLFIITLCILLYEFGKVDGNKPNNILLKMMCIYTIERESIQWYNQIIFVIGCCVDFFLLSRDILFCLIIFIHISPNLFIWIFINFIYVCIIYTFLFFLNIFTSCLFLVIYAKIIIFMKIIFLLSFTSMSSLLLSSFEPLSSISKSSFESSLSLSYPR